MLLEPRITRSSAGAAPASVHRLWPFLTALPWAAMVALLIGWWWAPAALQKYAYAPLLLSVVLLGLPHGALDHLVPGRLGWAWGRSCCSGRCTRLWPGSSCWAAFWLFLPCSLLHWGQGDLHHLERAGGHLGARWAAHRAAAADLPGVWGAAGARRGGGLRGAAGGRAAVAPLIMQELGLMFLLLVVYVADTLRCTSGAAACAQELGEAALVPAPLAIGTYFALWHAPRHLGRLRLLRASDAAQIGLGRIWRPARRLARDLLPITLAALGLLGGLYLWSAARVHSLEGFTALYLTFISALTLPHALVVAGMDLRPRRG